MDMNIISGIFALHFVDIVINEASCVNPNNEICKYVYI